MSIDRTLWCHGVCWSLVGAFLMGGCGGTPPQNPPTEGVTLKVYSKTVVGYTS